MPKFERYTSIGCYPLFYIVDGWQALCAGCAEESESPSEQAVNWEDANLYCDECSCRLESAYNEPEKKEEINPTLENRFVSTMNTTTDNGR